MSFQFLPGKNVEVPEISYKDNISLAAEETALIVVDIQNDFVEEGGQLVAPAASQTMPYIRDLLGFARSSRVPIAYAQDTHFEGDKEWDIWPEHCRAGTWGWQISTAGARPDLSEKPL